MNLYEFLGISKEEHDVRIEPFMKEIYHKEKKVDQALLAIETNPELTRIEVIYCAYKIGLTVGENPGTRRSFIKRLMGLELEDT